MLCIRAFEFVVNLFLLLFCFGFGRKTGPLVVGHIPPSDDCTDIPPPNDSVALIPDTVALIPDIVDSKEQVMFNAARSFGSMEGSKSPKISSLNNSEFV